MASYVILQHFEGVLDGSMMRLRPGTIVDDSHYDIQLLRDGGASLIAYKADMGTNVGAGAGRLVRNLGN